MYDKAARCSNVSIYVYISTYVYYTKHVGRNKNPPTVRTV